MRTEKTRTKFKKLKENMQEKISIFITQGKGQIKTETRSTVKSGKLSIYLHTLQTMHNLISYTSYFLSRGFKNFHKIFNNIKKNIS